MVNNATLPFTEFASRRSFFRFLLYRDSYPLLYLRRHGSFYSHNNLARWQKTRLTRVFDALFLCVEQVLGVVSRRALEPAARVLPVLAPGEKLEKRRLDLNCQTSLPQAFHCHSYLAPPLGGIYHLTYLCSSSQVNYPLLALAYRRLDVQCRLNHRSPKSLVQPF